MNVCHTEIHESLPAACLALQRWTLDNADRAASFAAMVDAKSRDVLVAIASRAYFLEHCPAPQMLDEMSAPGTPGDLLVIMIGTEHEPGRFLSLSTLAQALNHVQ